jgi:hypothetical protein
VKLEPQDLCGTLDRLQSQFDAVAITGLFFRVATAACLAVLCCATLVLPKEISPDQSYLLRDKVSFIGSGDVADGRVGGSLVAPSNSVALTHESKECGSALARSLVELSSTPAALRADVNESAPYGGGIVDVTCVEVTGRSPDVEFDVASGGSAGFLAWAAYRKVAAGWEFTYWQGGPGRIPIGFWRHDIIVTVGRYRHGDYFCCPTNGYENEELHWNGLTFVSFVGNIGEQLCTWFNYAPAWSAPLRWGRPRRLRSGGSRVSPQRPGRARPL